MSWGRLSGRVAVTVVFVEQAITRDCPGSFDGGSFSGGAVDGHSGSAGGVRGRV
ncbi:hypothetical protein ACFFX0_22955 [Citricoccus parietis]|uniref:Uncharacterized protein n=1 Tax=Citricoccus parietis TaxID=592307 RepID=A0ABV5G4N0_9MICC